MVPGKVNSLRMRCWQSVWRAKAVSPGSQASRWPGHTVKVQGLVGMQGPLQSEGGLGTRLHLHDDGFLGDFSLLFGDYKENSRNSEGYSSASI